MMTIDKSISTNTNNDTNMYDNKSVKRLNFNQARQTTDTLATPKPPESTESHP